LKADDTLMVTRTCVKVRSTPRTSTNLPTRLFGDSADEKRLDNQET